MDPLIASAITFAIVLGGALAGMGLRTSLPKQHLIDESRDVMKLGVGLVGTMAAMVLGLLVNSAKSSFDTQSNELTQMSANVILVDRILAAYGPEAEEARETMRKVFLTVDEAWAKYPSVHARGERISGAELLYDKVQSLSPKDDLHRLLRTQALNIAVTIGQTRWLMFEQSTTTVSKPLLVVMVFWLTIIFTSWGLLATRNSTLVVTMVVVALSVSGAIFLILELYTPYRGLIHISDAPLRAALLRLGQ